MRTSTILLGLTLICLSISNLWLSQSCGAGGANTPLDMETLKKTLSHVRGEAKTDEGWPRVIEYEHAHYDFRKDGFYNEERTFTVRSQPSRIIPHAVGVSEILWAICPRERIVAFNELSADPDISFIADQVKKDFPVLNSRQTEVVIGYQPDLVFTVFYSDADFKEKLEQAKIPFFDLGYFGTIESIKKQILLIGRVVGEEGNAGALVNVMDEKILALKKRIPKIDKLIRVLYYDDGGYIPGKASNFESICDIIGVVNVGAEQGIKSWSQIDYETLLKWNPDIIVVREGSHLREQLMASEVLSLARAIQKGKVYDIPGVYLTAHSQYMLLSANLLAGIVYENLL